MIFCDKTALPFITDSAITARDVFRSRIPRTMPPPHTFARCRGPRGSSPVATCRRMSVSPSVPQRRVTRAAGGGALSRRHTVIF